MNRWSSILIALLTVVLPLPAPAAEATSCCASSNDVACCCCSDSRRSSDHGDDHAPPGFERRSGCPCATPVDAPPTAPASALTTTGASSLEFTGTREESSFVQVAPPAATALLRSTPPERPPSRTWLALSQSFLL